MSITTDQSNYFYLKALDASDQLWPKFTLQNLTADANGLRLTSLPAVEETVGPAFGDVSDFAGPAGIGTGPDGAIYIADPLNHQVLRVDPCDGTTEALPCLRGPGWEPGWLNRPRGVLAGPRDALYVADSGNHRIQIIDLLSGQLRDIWGHRDPWDEPDPSTEPGCFQHPWDLAADSLCMIYVADPGSQADDGSWSDGRVQKFDADGRLDSTFSDTISAQPEIPGAPASVAIALSQSGDQLGERLLVLDLEPVRLLVYTLDGSFDAQETDRWSDIANYLQVAGSIAISNEAVYVADLGTGRVLIFAHDGAFVGFAHGIDGPVSSLAIDSQGRLLIHPGAGGSVLRLQPDTAYAEAGSFLAGPFDSGQGAVFWHELAVEAEPLATPDHVQLFTLVTDDDTPQSPPGLDPGPPWLAAPRDADSSLIGGQPGQYIWIAGVLSGDSTSTPRIHQIRLEHSHEGWLRYLPAIYQRDDQSRIFLDQMLSLFESMLRDGELLIEDLPLLFDALATPDESSAPWLDWLSGWVDQPLDERWDDETRRDAIAHAFQAHARRGTVASLRDVIKLHTGATAHITEPARNASLWMLESENSVLNFSTRLVPAEAEGAVLGTTAILTQSHLIDEESFGAPLFDDLAHCFFVQVYAAELTNPERLDEVRAVIDREKPAHTSYQLCAIEADMRVGFQARIGIDTIVGSSERDFRLSGEDELGFETWLAGGAEDARIGGTIGRNTRIGTRTQLT